MFRIYSTVLLILLSSMAYSQPIKSGAWGILTITLPSDTGHRFGGYIEGKIQTNEPSFQDIYHREYKGGISYALNHNYIILVGAGQYITDDYMHIIDGPILTENRVWEQMTMNGNLGRMLFEHRYRAEQRWLNKDYRSSFKYKLTATLPLNHKKIVRNTLYLSAFDEISLGLKAYSFERNRMSATLGFQFFSDLGLQAGWIFEDNNSLSNNLERHNLLVNLLFQFQRKQHKNPQAPAEK